MTILIEHILQYVLNQNTVFLHVVKLFKFQSLWCGDSQYMYGAVLPHPLPS